MLEIFAYLIQVVGRATVIKQHLNVQYYQKIVVAIFDITNVIKA